MRFLAFLIFASSIFVGLHFFKLGNQTVGGIPIGVGLLILVIAFRPKRKYITELSLDNSNVSSRKTLDTSRCGVCQNLINKKFYEWNINGERTNVCPHCSTALDRKKSREAIKQLK